MINKVKDIMTDISSDNINLGDIGVKFYTEDKNTVAIRIFINKGKNRIDLEKFDYTVRLDLFHSDGSIWIDEPVRIVNPSIGLIQYNIPDNIIKHYGKIEAKLFFKKDTNSMHVLNFNFNIIDSGINDAIEKEISVNLVDDSVRKIIQENAIELLGEDFKDDVSVELQNYVNKNKEEFRGLSSYQLAVQNGFKGTENDWLDSLKLSATNQQLNDIKSQIVNSINKPTIINTPTCAGRNRAVETDLRSLKDYGLQFTSFVDGYITSFDVFSSGVGVVDFYLTDYGGSNIPANVEYKRIKRKLSAGWNTIEFVHKIESNKEYCLAVSFTDAISLAIGSTGTYDAVNTQNPHLIKPNRAYRPPYGNTGTAYLFIFNVQVSIDNNSRLILNQLTNNTFEVSNVEPSNDTSIWIKPQSNGG